LETAITTQTRAAQVGDHRGFRPNAGSSVSLFVFVLLNGAADGILKPAKLFQNTIDISRFVKAIVKVRRAMSAHEIVGELFGMGRVDEAVT